MKRGWASTYVVGLAGLALALLIGGASRARAAPAAPAALLGDLSFVHTVTPANRDAVLTHTTTLSHPAANGNPDAVLFTTANWNPYGTRSGVDNNHPEGVYYRSALQAWAIFNEDQAYISDTVAFNVWITQTSANVFTHVATAGNTLGNYTTISHTLTNGNPNLLLFVTQNWSVGSHLFNPAPAGVYYAGGQWAIRNDDLAAMPEGAGFNVFATPANAHAFVHTVVTGTAANATHNRTYLDHPLLNNNPGAMVLVTHTYNPGGTGNNDHPHVVGVWYDNDVQRWAIFNQDFAVPMVNGTKFNVLVGDARFYLPLAAQP